MGRQGSVSRQGLWSSGSRETQIVPCAQSGLAAPPWNCRRVGCSSIGCEGRTPDPCAFSDLWMLASRLLLVAWAIARGPIGFRIADLARVITRCRLQRSGFQAAFVAKSRSMHDFEGVCVQIDKLFHDSGVLSVIVLGRQARGCHAASVSRGERGRFVPALPNAVSQGGVGAIVR